MAQIFTKNVGGALNCSTFLSDSVVACGSDKGEIIMIDLRNTRQVIVFHVLDYCILYI